MAEKIQGVVAVYVYEGRVVAHAADFRPDKPGGFTQYEAQRSRAEDAIAFAVIRECCSPLIYQHALAYDCRNLLQRMPGRVELIPIGYADEERR